MDTTPRILLAYLVLSAMLVPATAHADSTSLAIQAQLKQPKSGDCDFLSFFGFGRYLAMAQGNAIVGESYVPAGPGRASFLGTGCTVVYEPDGAGGWNVQQILHASGPLAASGNTLLVGLAVFTRYEGMWGPRSILPGPSPTNDVRTNQALTDSAAVDGTLAVIGFGNAESAYVYTLDPSGLPTHNVVLTASDSNTGDHFGCSSALSDAVLAVGSHSAVYVFQQNASGDWIEQAKLAAGDCTAVTVMDGLVLYVGPTGEVRVARQTSPARWTVRRQFAAPGTEDVFLASGNGVFAVAAPSASPDPSGKQGSVDLYDESDIASGMPLRHVDNARAMLWFGGPLALDRHYLLVGEDGCQDGAPCTPMTVDVVDVSDRGAGDTGVPILLVFTLLLVSRRRR